MSSLALDRVDCFSVFALADPSVLPRLLDVFGLLSLIPSRVHSTLLDQDGGQLVVDFQISGLTQAEACRLARRLERTITVSQVLWSEKQRAAA